MGSCSSRSAETPDPEWMGSDHSGNAPMFLVAVNDVLKMVGRMEPHEELYQKGLVKIWSSKMTVIFVSHQWLGLVHPDPNGEQLRVLQDVLLGLVSGSTKIILDTFHVYQNLRILSAEECRQLQDAFIWLDYFCVPQKSDQQQLYVKSIPRYVNLSQVFLALVPPLLSTETGLVCDYDSWLERGWCRTEMWCKRLSSASDIPIILVTDSGVARFTHPLWLHHPVHSGEFSVEEDRASCVGVVERALKQKMAELKRVKDWENLRFLMARSDDMLGRARRNRSLEDFVVEFGFPGDMKSYKGLGPVACATLTGDCQLVRQLVSSKALLQTHMPGIPDMDIHQNSTPLHLACQFMSCNFEMLETLLELRADLNSSAITVPLPLGMCRAVGALEVLLRHGADVNAYGKDLGGFCAIHMMAGSDAPVETVAKLLELRGNVNGVKAKGMSPYTALAVRNGLSKNAVEVAQLLLQNRADVDQAFQPQGLARKAELVCRAVQFCCKGETPFLAKVLANYSSTPLAYCALHGNETLMTFLLSAHADPNIKNSAGLRPIDLASSERILKILRSPGEHIAFLESNSPLVSEYM